MNSFFVFARKELEEQIKTFKGVAIAAVLLIFGMSSPLLAKLTPEIIKSVGVGITIKMPDPTYLDAYSQFFKNISQMAIIIIMLVYVGAVVAETTKGTATLMLTKRLSRTSFILSKFLSAAIVWTVSYAGSAVLCAIYTVYLFPKGSPSHLVLAFFCMWLFGIITLGIALFASAVFKNYTLAAIGGFVIWGLLLLSSALPKIKDYMPAFLTTGNMQILSGSCPPGTAIVPVIAGIVLTAMLLTLACLIFHRREL